MKVLLQHGNTTHTIYRAKMVEKWTSPDLEYRACVVKHTVKLARAALRNPISQSPVLSFLKSGCFVGPARFFVQCYQQRPDFLARFYTVLPLDAQRFQ